MRWSIFPLKAGKSSRNKTTKKQRKMKKKVFAALVGAVLVLSSFTVAKGSVGELVDYSLNQAVSQKVISETERQQLVESGIIDVAYETFTNTKGDAKATVNAVADKLVEQGYFSSRAAAKKEAKRMAENARKNDSLAKKLYQYLGI